MTVSGTGRTLTAKVRYPLSRVQDCRRDVWIAPEYIGIQNNLDNSKSCWEYGVVFLNTLKMATLRCILKCFLYVGHWQALSDDKKQIFEIWKFLRSEDRKPVSPNTINIRVIHQEARIPSYFCWTACTGEGWSWHVNRSLFLRIGWWDRTGGGWRQLHPHHDRSMKIDSLFQHPKMYIAENQYVGYSHRSRAKFKDKCFDFTDCCEIINNGKKLN